MLINWLKKIGIVLLELALLAGLLSYIYQKKGFQSVDQIVPAMQRLAANVKSQSVGNPQEKVFPELQNPISRVYNWEYRGEKYSLTEKLYQSTYEYYGAQPKSFTYVGEIKQNWEDDYYGMFLKGNAKDESIAQLALDIQKLGRQHKFSDDQIIDLTLAFVQTIKYDDARAKEILSKTGDVKMQYPYETLFLQSGVCSDKSLLAVALLREMKYGAAIFTFQQENHMAIGVQCPKSASTYGSGYCYAETTSTGNKIGIIPSFDSTSNKAVGANELPALDSSQAQQASLQQLTQVSIFQQSVGREYGGIVETKKIMIEIDNLKKSIATLLSDLQAQKKAITVQEKKLEDMKKELESYQNGESVEKYNALVQKYNSFLENYKKNVKKYNEQATLYNKTIQRYNVLIKQ